MVVIAALAWRTRKEALRDGGQSQVRQHAEIEIIKNNLFFPLEERRRRPAPPIAQSDGSERQENPSRRPVSALPDPGLRARLRRRAGLPGRLRGPLRGLLRIRLQRVDREEPHTQRWKTKENSVNFNLFLIRIHVLEI